MIEIFNYEFMRRAFIVGTLLSIILPCVGLTVVLKRLSMVGDTLAHSSLAGVALGLVFGFNPLIGSIFACILAGFSIEFIRNKLKAYQEISTVIILAFSIGIAGIFSSFMNNTNAISSYLFGSIVSIDDKEFVLVILVFVIVLAIYKFIYRQLYLCVLDSKFAKFLGVNVKLINFLFTFISAIAISISAKTIGSLIVSSLLVLPVITAMQFSRSYKGTLILSIVFSLFSVNLGLFISYYYDLKPGSVIVLFLVFVLLIAFIIKNKRVF